MTLDEFCQQVGIKENREEFERYIVELEGDLVEEEDEEFYNELLKDFLEDQFPGMFEDVE